VTFEVIPAIDLLDGRVVRLQRGELETKTVYADDPVATAKEWEAQGAGRLHVVDLGGAMAGESVQDEVIEEIVLRVDIPVQVAGGIRSVEAGERWIGRGADRVVLGTAVLTDLNMLGCAVDRLGSRFIAAPDALGREVRISGWRTGTGEDVADAARRLAAAGVPRIIVTDIGQDGMLAGPNVELMREVSEAARIPVIASGGISSLDDLRMLSEVDGIEGAIVGKALYTGAIELSRAVKEVA
jgi:phosphoribosylformimino-5-aminoimidazole carboxamide ribotide isomerase